MNDLAPDSGLSPSSSEAQWADRSPSELIEHILRRYHDPLHSGLAGLVKRAREVESLTQGQPLSPVGLGEHLEQIRIAVESHLAKEENILFPLIRAGRGGRALMPVKVMMAEHEDHVANLTRTRVLTHDFELPADAAAPWRELYRELRSLEADLDAHIDLENNVLFPRAIGSGDGL
jgi:regulator of cell morphogenesis and NO signaling